MPAQAKCGFDRRRLVHIAGGLVTAAGVSLSLSAAADDGTTNKMPDVTPPEDLMREHGILNRTLLIYEASIRKLSNSEDFDRSIVYRSADIIRTFIEQYHERNEENQIFPRFRKAGKLVDLVNTLYQQHQAGRRLTDIIIKITSDRLAADDKPRLVGAMQSFIVMYRPHESREDTVLFPALRKVVSPNEFDAMAEDFEKDEHARFGQDGFETMVDKVAELEKALGINDLAKFTAS